MSPVLIAAIAVAVTVAASLAFLAYALCRMSADDPDEPQQDPDTVEALDRLGDDTDAVIFEWPRPYWRGSGGGMA